jgi:hypothetical protein
VKIKPSLRSEIYQAARRCVSGASPLFEVGYRSKEDSLHVITANANLWYEDADLNDMLPLRVITELEFDINDRCALDLYATTGIGDRRELETNVTVWLVKEGDKVRLIGAWECGPGSPEWNKTKDEVEAAWQRLEHQPVNRIRA